MFLRTSLKIAACLLALSTPAWATPVHTFAFGQPAAASQATRTIEIVMGDMNFDRKPYRSRPVRRFALYW